MRTLTWIVGSSLAMSPIAWVGLVSVALNQEQLKSCSFRSWRSPRGRCWVVRYCIPYPAPMEILLPVDGSAASVAGVQEVARCPMPSGSTVELLYAIHSRLPVIPDFPPWAVTIAAAHGESIREQTFHAPEVLAAAAKHLQAHQRSITIVTKTVDGVPKDEILREAVALGADRIVLGSQGRGRGERVILGSTAAAVAAEARRTVHVARPRAADHRPDPKPREPPAEIPAPATAVTLQVA
jgi:nucleotide-binding universal stress UspA family protein